MLSIRLLGMSQVLDDGQPLALKRRKSRALLYYLAAHPQPVSRRQVLGLLWPDHAPATARHNLRTTLYSLRQALGFHLAAEDERLALTGAVEVDVRELVRVMEAGEPNEARLTAALAHYQGDFLADFDLPDAPEYENWIAVERERYRRLAINGFHLLSRRREAAGDYAAARQSLAQALAIDPFQEDLQRAALRLDYLAGDRAGAIRRFEELRRMLDEEMGVPPMAETRALYDAIITDTLPLPASLLAAQRVSSPTPVLSVDRPAADGVTAQPVENGAPVAANPLAGAALPFAGRAIELAQLHTWRGQGRLILVEGETGLGKTRLVERFLEQCNADRATLSLILVGRARELESRLPYQPWIEALRGLLASPAWSRLQPQLQLPPLWWQEVARLAPELAPAAPPVERSADESRLWEGIYQFLAALARVQPVLLFMDDLHWADAATLGLVGYLVRQSFLAGAAAPNVAPDSIAVPLTVLATSRPVAPRSEATMLVQSLLREERLARLVLDRLTADDVLALARQLSSAYGYPLGSWLYRASEGNPFVLAELIRYARTQGILTAEGVVNLNLLPTTIVVPPTVYTLIQARLAPLSDAARRVLETAVTVGREFEFEVVARAAALSDSATLDALDELRQAKLIQPVDAQRFAFDHTLTLEVAYQEVGEARHRLLHRRVAAALESIHHDRLDEAAGLIVYHYTEGGQPEQAAPYAWRAGRRAASLAAWRAVAEFYQQALMGSRAEQRPAVLAALGNAQLQAGALAQATDTLRQALEAAPQEAATLQSVVQGLGESLILQARYPEVLELARTLTDHPHPTIRFAAEFMWGAALSLQGQDLAEAIAHLRVAETELRTHPADAPIELLAQVEFELGNLAAQQGQLTEAVAHYREALRLTATGRSDESQRIYVLAHNNLAYHLHLLGDPEATSYAQRAAELVRDKGMLTLFSYVASTQGELALAAGDLAAAEGYFQQGLANAQRLAQRERIAGLTANLGLVAQRRGQPELAVHRFTIALAEAEVISSRFLAAQLHLWLAPLSPPATARKHLAAARAIIDAGRYHRLEPALLRLEESLVGD
jgi:DNA-binding SARP family transcriptional activator